MFLDKALNSLSQTFNPNKNKYAEYRSAIKSISAESLDESEKRLQIVRCIVPLISQTDLDIIQILCFGSVSRGTARESSDTDILCVTKKEIVARENESKYKKRIRKELKRCGVKTGGGSGEISIMVINKNDFYPPYQHIIDPTILIEAKRDGIVLFDNNQH